jgi:hypothetical protein
MAFDERNYQTGVAQFNAGTAAGVSQFNAGQANSMAVSAAKLGMQQQQMNMEYGDVSGDPCRSSRRPPERCEVRVHVVYTGDGGRAAAGFVPGGGPPLRGCARCAGRRRARPDVWRLLHRQLRSHVAGVFHGLGAYGTYTSWQSAAAESQDAEHDDEPLSVADRRCPLPGTTT